MAYNGGSYSLAGNGLAQSPVVADAAGNVSGTLDLDWGGDDQQMGILNATSGAADFSLIALRESDESRDNDFRNLDQWLAINPSNQMAAVWRINQNGSTHVASTVTNQGAWTQSLFDATIIDDVPSAVAANCAYPLVTSDEHGYWHALWIDNRYGQWATYSSSSKDGLTWLPSTRVSAFYDESGSYDPKTGRAKAFLGDYNSIAAVSGKIYAAWVDTRNGSSQVFFASAPNPL